jgi:hypothetical protein
MNVKPGMKAAIDLGPNRSNELFCGVENHGIVCVVNELKPPGLRINGNRTYDSGEPEWVVTSISRPFQEYKLGQFGEFMVVKPAGNTWNAVVADKYLRPIVEDDTPVGIVEKAEI